jgi:hypothetical protein
LNVQKSKAAQFSDCINQEVIAIACLQQLVKGRKVDAVMIRMTTGLVTSGALLPGKDPGSQW